MWFCAVKPVSASLASLKAWESASLARRRHCATSARRFARTARFIRSFNNSNARLIFVVTTRRRKEKAEALLASEPRDTVALFAALLSLPPSERHPALALSAQQQKEKTLAALLRGCEVLRSAVRLPAVRRCAVDRPDVDRAPCLGRAARELTRLF